MISWVRNITALTSFVVLVLATFTLFDGQYFLASWQYAVAAFAGITVVLSDRMTAADVELSE